MRLRGDWLSWSLGKMYVNPTPIVLHRVSWPFPRKHAGATGYILTGGMGRRFPHQAF